jgi:TRAP-type C4-dicarboxylate transport system permease small subunit
MKERGPVAFARAALGPFLRLQDGLSLLTFWIAMASVAYLTLATAVEVVLRYAFQAPTGWAPDTSAVAFSFIAFLAVPQLTRTSGHASMTFLVDSAPGALGLWMTRLSLAVAAAICALLAWFGWFETLRLIRGGVTMIAVTPIPKALVVGVIVYGLASASLYFLRLLAASFQAPRADAQGEAAA